MDDDDDGDDNGDDDDDDDVVDDDEDDTTASTPFILFYLSVRLVGLSMKCKLAYVAVALMTSWTSSAVMLNSISR